jgi:GTP-binding protein
MLPVIALVGHPNVGKSTLFNYLTRTRSALVADLPGLTRDRQYGTGRVGGFPYIVVDTGGLTGGEEGLEGLMAGQVWVAVREADAVVFLVDARDGRGPADEVIAGRLRELGKPVFLAVNKSEHMEPLAATAEFHSLGLGEPHRIAAAHGHGVAALLEAVSEVLPPSLLEEHEEGPEGTRVAVLGRPNVGKSTLVNRLVGEERVLAYDKPGTTRDSIQVPFERDGRGYVLIDTAGVRRRSRVNETIEKFSVIKTLQAIEEANVVVLVLDAQAEVGEQDARLLGHVLEAGRALVIAVNKWDGLEREQRETIRRELGRKLSFVDFAAIHYISALHGSGVGPLLQAVDRAYQSATAHFPTPRLTRILEDAVAVHAPPSPHGRRIKLRYAHQGGRNPPLIVVHGNQTDAVPDGYRRYLANTYRRVLELEGTPVRVELKTGANPYAGRKNVLTERQQRKRKRLIQHAKRR